MEPPLNKVVFIQRVATFAARSLQEIIQLAFVNNAWSDTVQNFGTTSVDQLVRAGHTTFSRAQKCGVKWAMRLILSKSFLILNDSCLRLTCLNKEPKEIEFLLEWIGKAGGPDVLKNQLTATDSKGKNCLMWLCSQNASSERIKLIVDASLEVDSSKELLSTLLSATDEFGRSCIMLLCSNENILKNPALTVEILQVIFNSIVVAGDSALLEAQLTATDKWGNTFLFSICSSSLLSVEMIEFIWSTIDKTCGRDLLHSQLATTDKYGNNCIMLLCKKQRSSLKEILSLFFEKIVEVGEEGPKLLSTQLAATSNTDRANCLMSYVSRSSASIEVMKLILDKSVEVGGPDLVMTQLTAIDKDGHDTLMLLCRNSSASEQHLELVFDKIVNNQARDDAELWLKKRLTATDDKGFNLLMRICSLSSSSPSLVEKLRFILRMMIARADGGKTDELLKSQLTAMTSDHSTCFMLSCQSYSSSPEVMKLVATLLHHFNLFKTQYEQLPEQRRETVEEDLCSVDYPDQQYKTVVHGHDYRGHLRSGAKIENAWWSPTSKDVADLKGILKGTGNVQKRSSPSSRDVTKHTGTRSRSRSPSTTKPRSRSRSPSTSGRPPMRF